VKLLTLVENLDAVMADFAQAGFATRKLEPHNGLDVRALRTHLGLSAEKDGRRPLDSTARSYLTAIANEPAWHPAAL
jgi:hypothetical protein